MYWLRSLTLQVSLRGFGLIRKKEHMAKFMVDTN